MIRIVLALYLLNSAFADTGYYSVFRSHDKGQTWIQSDSGLPRHARINAIAAAGANVLAGTDGGIFISGDGGRNWESAGPAATAGRTLAFATVGTSVYAGTDRNGVLMSRDGGRTWTRAAAGFNKLRTLLAHGGALYAGTDAQGVFVTRDSGRTWTSMNMGLPGGAQIFALAGLKGHVFAALYGKGLYVWTEQAQSWRRSGSVTPLALATDGQTLLAGHNPGGIFRSHDLGVSWRRADIALSADLGNAPVWELAGGSDFALGGVASGVYRSDDHGQRWVRSSTGLPRNSSGIAFLLGKWVTFSAVFIPGARGR